MPTVLVTRAAADAPPLCDALRAAGLTPVGVPLLERVYEVEAVARVAADGHDGWVLTSPAAVEALRRAGVSARPRWVACVGPATAAAARDLGLAVDLVPETATAADLAAALGERSGQRVLYPRADLARSGSLEALRGTGAVVDDIVAYRNVEPAGAAEALAVAWPVDAVALLSGSAVRRLAAHVPPPWPATRVVVIGPSTAAAAGRAGLPVHAQADPHTLEGLVDAVVAALAPRGGGSPTAGGSGLP